MAGRSKRWSRAETLFLISTLEELDILKRFDGRKYKNGELFQAVATKLSEGGFTHRDTSQVINKWKWLKQEYNKAKAQNNKSGSDPSSFEFFEEVDRVLGRRPLANAETHGVDVGFNDSQMTEQHVSDDDSALEGPSTSTGSAHSASRSSTPISDQAVDTPEDDRAATSESFERQYTTTPTVDASGIHPKRRRNTTKARSGYERALQTWSEQQLKMLQDMQERQQQWTQRQQELREERDRQQQQREENFITRLFEQNSRSTERLFGVMFEGLRSLLPSPQAGPPPPQHYHHPSQHTQHGHRGSSADSDYNLFHM